MNMKKMAGLVMAVVTFGVSPYASACASNKDLKIKVGDTKVQSIAVDKAVIQAIGSDEDTHIVVGGFNEKGEQVETNVNGAVTTKKQCQNHVQKNC